MIGMAGFIPQLDPRRASRASNVQRKMLRPPTLPVDLPFLGMMTQPQSIQLPFLTSTGTHQTTAPEVASVYLPFEQYGPLMPQPVNLLFMAQQGVTDTHRVPWNYPIMPEPTEPSPVVDEIDPLRTLLYP